MEVGGAEDIAFESVVAETFAEILAVNTVGTDSDYDDLCLNQFGVETFVFPWEGVVVGVGVLLHLICWRTKIYNIK